MTAASFQREMDYCQALWGAQKRFLESMDPRLAEVFQPFSRHPYFAFTKYIQAKLSRDRTFASTMSATWPSSPYRTQGMYGFGRSRFICPTGCLILPSIS